MELSGIRKAVGSNGRKFRAMSYEKPETKNTEHETTNNEHGTPNKVNKEKSEVRCQKGSKE